MIKYINPKYLIKAFRFKRKQKKYQKSFKNFGTNTFLNNPLEILGSQNISIGSNVNIMDHVRLAAVPLTNAKVCNLEIGDGCSIGYFNHIFATSSIKFGKKVLTADKVYIADNSHNYLDISIPIMDQSIVQKNNVIIDDGTWIGENACIIGCHIGKNCIIGANSIVLSNIPDYSVVVGMPAKIIKRFCLETNSWKKTDEKGNFIS
jgi:acetyltransferase-like isoleucine patch superfamily enzyme